MKNPIFIVLSLIASYLSAANVYVPNYGSSNISVVSTASNTVTATIAVGNNPNATAVTPNGLYLYVPNNADDTVSVINTATNSIIATVSVGSGPSSVAITPNGAYAYVTNQNDSTVSVIQNASNGSPSVLTFFSVDTSAVAIAITPDGNYAYIADNNDPGAVYQVNHVSTGSPSIDHAAIPVGSTPVALAITPNSNYVYVVNYGNGSSNSSVSVIQNASTSSPSVVATVGVGISPVAAAITPNGNYAYISNLGSNTISIIQNASTTSPSVAASFSISSPYAVAFTKDGNIAYVTKQGANSVAVLQNASTSSPSTLTTVGVGSLPSNSGCLGISLPHQALVLNSSGSSLYMIDETSLNLTPALLSLGSSIFPQNIVLTNDRMHAYVTQNTSNPGVVSCIAIDYENLYPLKTTASITVGPNPTGMVLSPDGNYIYVIDQGSGGTSSAVYRIQVSTNTATLLGTLPSAPGCIGIDPTGSYLVVTLPVDSEVAVISSITGTATINTVLVGINPNAISFDLNGNGYVTCSGSDDLYRINLSTRSTSNLALSGTNPGAMSYLTISGTRYLLIAMNNSLQVNLVNTSTFTLTSSSAIAAAATQIVVNPSIASVAYLIEPSANAIQSIDFTSSTTSPTISSQVSTGSNPIGGGCKGDGTQLFILNLGAGSVSVFSLSGSHKETITSASGSPVTGLGSPQGISVCP